MNIKRRLAAVVGFALITMVSTSGGAAEPPGQAMADVAQRLTAASLHAAALAEAIDRQAPLTAPATADTAPAASGAHDIGPWSQGGGHPAKASLDGRPARPLTDDMTAALDGLEATVREARTLAGGHPYLEPGIGHVLTNAGRIRAGADPSIDPSSLSHEMAIELVSVANNARVLEAEADLRAASAARRWNRTDPFRGHLEAAVRVMTEARDRGAYHLDDDLATLRAILARVKEGASPREAVTGDAVAELIGDINEHLADLGGD